MAGKRQTYALLAGGLIPTATVAPTQISGTGTVAPAYLGTGTRNGHRLLRDDGVWVDQSPVNVKDYGATGDGTTNDTTAMRAAVAITNSTGRPLYFPAGTYLTDKLTLTRGGIVVYGDGSGVALAASKLKSLSGNTVLEVTNPSADCSYLTLRDFAVVGAGATGNTGHGIYLHDAAVAWRHVTLSRINVSVCGGNGIRFGNPANPGEPNIVFLSSCDHCTVQYCGDDLYYGYSLGPVFVFNQCLGEAPLVGKWAYNITAGQTVTFIASGGQDNPASTGYGGAVQLGSLSYIKATFLGCHFENWSGVGIDIKRGEIEFYGCLWTALAGPANSGCCVRTNSNPVHIVKFFNCVFDDGGTGWSNNYAIHSVSFNNVLMQYCRGSYANDTLFFWDETDAGALPIASSTTLAYRGAEGSVPVSRSLELTGYLTVGGAFNYNGPLTATTVVASGTGTFGGALSSGTNALTSGVATHAKNGQAYAVVKSSDGNGMAVLETYVTGHRIGAFVTGGNATYLVDTAAIDPSTDTEANVLAAAALYLVSRNVVFLGDVTIPNELTFAPSSGYLAKTVTSSRITFDLNAKAGPGFPCSDFNYPSGGKVRFGELNLDGTHDVLFQAIPLDASGYVEFESYGAAGLMFSTGGNTAPIIFRINRVEVARFATDGTFSTQKTLTAPRVRTGITNAGNVTGSYAPDIAAMQINMTATGGITLANPTGTPVDGDTLVIRIKSSAARTIAFGTAWRGGTTTPLPTTTTSGASTRGDYLTAVYDAADSKWDVLAWNQK